MNFSKKDSPNSGCFSNLLEKFICTGNLPTHPCSLEEIQVLEKKTNSIKNNISNNNNSVANVVKSRVQTQAEANPGIVARLMGLDSLPVYDNALKSSSTTYDSLFRSKSLNSLHFLPNFDPTRATFHRRARTSSASFHEQGRSPSVKIDEIFDTNGKKIKENDVGCRRDELREKLEKVREKLPSLKENEHRISGKNSESNCAPRNRTKCGSRPKNASARANVVGNNTNLKEKSEISRGKFVSKDKSIKIGSIVSSKNKIDRSDVSSRSPISVLDNLLEFDSPSKQENANVGRSRSKSRTKSSPKINIIDNMPRPKNNPKSNKNENCSSNKITSEHKLVNSEYKDIAEYFADLSKQIYALAEDQLCEDLTSHIRKYELFKCDFNQELCQDFGQDVIESLLSELTNELVESF